MFVYYIGSSNNAGLVSRPSCIGNIMGYHIRTIQVFSSSKLAVLVPRARRCCQPFRVAHVPSRTMGSGQLGGRRTSCWCPPYRRKRCTCANVSRCIASPREDGITYQAANAAIMPNAPPARSSGMFGPAESNNRYDNASMRNANMRVKNRKLNAKVDRRVRIQSKKVKMNQPNR